MNNFNNQDFLFIIILILTILAWLNVNLANFKLLECSRIHYYLYLLTFNISLVLTNPALQSQALVVGYKILFV